MSYQVPSTISSHGYLEGKSSFVLDPSEILAPAVSGSLVWQGDELSPTEYVVKLDDSHVLDIRAAVVAFKLEYPTSQFNTANSNSHSSHWTSARKDKHEHLRS